MERLLQLTEQQQNIVNLAKQGHNICILGRAGVGKSTTVDAIKKALTAKSETCQIICSTGISCQSYGGIAKTVHSYYGLWIAELPSQLLVERSLRQNDIVKQVAETNVLIWDEVSMTSSRILELVNRIHQSISQNNLAFAGIQVILVGDFWQLKPVPSPFDDGIPIYNSELFSQVFPHRIELTKVLRQNASESRLKSLLNFLRNGECSDEAEEYVHSLDRICTENDGLLPTHIYFKRIHVEIHNGNVLASLPGQLDTFDSIDTGNTYGMEKRAIPKALTLKPGCRIMLTYNINYQLKNGYKGKYVGKDPDDEHQLLVNFEHVGTIAITRRTWYKYSIGGNVQGSRTQFPITPCYAITVHKSQSLTLDSIVVHCAQEFVPGQTYVAISRVRSEERLQVIEFQRKFLLPQPVELANLATSCVDPDESYLCCRNHCLEDYSFKEDEIAAMPMNEQTDGNHNDVENAECNDAAIRRCFELNEDATEKLEDTLLCLSPLSQTELSVPPSTFSMETFLESTVTDLDDPFSESLNSASRYAIDNLVAFEILGNIIWCRIAMIFQQHLAENVADTTMSNKDFTFATSRIQKLFLSADYRNDLLSAFKCHGWSEISDGQRTLGAQLIFHLFQLFVTEIEKQLPKEDAHAVDFNVKEMGANGLGKVRYVGAWAIHKSLFSSRRYIMENKNSQASAVREKLNKELRKIDLLDSNVVTPYDILEKTTSDISTLNVTESRQYRERGLLHITDRAFEFFVTLEQERVNLINMERLSRLLAQVVDKSIESVLQNENIKNEFVALFNMELEGDKDLVLKLYEDVIVRYLKLGAGQFLRDFRREFHLKKAMAHRKAVLARKEKAEEKKNKIEISVIKNDRSPLKRSSHVRLVALAVQVKERGLMRLYKKKELEQLCVAYGIRYMAKWNKCRLAKELFQSITTCSEMPCHQSLSWFVIEEVPLPSNVSNRVPALRLRRV